MVSGLDKKKNEKEEKQKNHKTTRESKMNKSRKCIALAEVNETETQ